MEVLLSQIKGGRFLVLLEAHVEGWGSAGYCNGHRYCPDSSQCLPVVKAVIWYESRVQTMPETDVQDEACRYLCSGGELGTGGVHAGLPLHPVPEARRRVAETCTHGCPRWPLLS